MGIAFEKQNLNSRPNVFWREARKVLPGGLKLLQTFPDGTILTKGTFVSVQDGLTGAIVKVAKVIAGGTTTAPRVSKNNCFEVGDVIMRVGGVAKTVQSIDRSNAGYDVVTFDASVTSLAAGDFLVEATGTSDPSQKYVANACLESDLVISSTNGIATMDVCYDAFVIKSVAQPIPASWLVDGGFSLKANPLIKVLNQ